MRQLILRVPEGNKEKVFKAVEENKGYQRRLLVRLIGVRLSQLVHGNQQISLLEDTAKEISLHQALDYIKNKHGTDKIIRAFSL